MVECPKCGRRVIDAIPDGGYKLRSRMIIFKDGIATALCPSCKASVTVPVQLNIEKQPVNGPKLIVTI